MIRGEGGEFVEPQPIVESERRNDLPFILQVDAFDPFRLGAVIGIARGMSLI